MIREILESGYERTIGSLLKVVSRLTSPVKTRGGLPQLLYVLAVTGLMAGFVSAVDFPVPNQGVIIYPGGGAQTIPEAVIDASVILLGAGGVYLTFISGRQTTKARSVGILLGAAMGLIALSVLTGMSLALLK